MKTVRGWLLSAIGLCSLVAASVPAQGIPAFARRTGLRCTACHEAWPVLNDFGRAFRDNGYQLRTGKDKPTDNPFAFWPVSFRLTPSYQYNSLSAQQTDQGKKTLGSGGVADAAMDFLAAGTLNEDVGFLVVPTGFASNGNVHLESYWVYFSRLFANSDWFNVRVGKHEVDLPVSAHRSIELTNSYLIYNYHPAAAGDIAGAFAIDQNQRGFEITGHDRGSFTRYNFSVFDGNGSPGSRNGFESPSFYGHFQKYWQMDSYGLSEVELGAWGAYAQYPTKSLTSGGQPIGGAGGSLRPSERYGVEASVLLGPSTTPVHLSLVLAHGQDNKDLYQGAAVQNATWNGGFFEAIWVPPMEGLHMSLFTRYDVIRNQKQPTTDVPKSLDDQDQVTVGMKYTLAFFNRNEYAIHLEYATNQMKHMAFDGGNQRASSVFGGIDFAF
jgi:hypothetical protein